MDNLHKSIPFHGCWKISSEIGCIGGLIDNRRDQDAGGNGLKRSKEPTKPKTAYTARSLSGEIYSIGQIFGNDG